MDGKTRAYFKQEYFKRSRVARALDSLLLGFLLWFGYYQFFLWALPTSRGAVLLAVLAGCTTLCALLLWQSIRFDRFAKQRAEELRNEALLWHLAQLSDNALMDVVVSAGEPLMAVRPVTGGFVGKTAGGKREFYAVFLRHPTEKLCASDLLAARRLAALWGAGALTVLSTAPLSDTAKNAQEQLSFRLIGPKELLALAQPLGLLPKDEAVAAAVEARVQTLARRRQSLKSSLVLPGAARRYAMAGAALLALSLLARFKTYYVFTGLLCLALALLSLLGLRRGARSQGAQNS